MLPARTSYSLVHMTWRLLWNHELTVNDVGLMMLPMPVRKKSTVQDYVGWIDSRWRSSIFSTWQQRANPHSCQSKSSGIPFEKIDNQSYATLASRCSGTWPLSTSCTTVSHKIDVYAFSVVRIELVFRRKLVGSRDPKVQDI